MGTNGPPNQPQAGIHLFYGVSHLLATTQATAISINLRFQFWGMPLDWSDWHGYSTARTGSRGYSRYKYIVVGSQPLTEKNYKTDGYHGHSWHYYGYLGIALMASKPYGQLFSCFFTKS